MNEHDQAARLRELVQQSTAIQDKQKTKEEMNARVIAVASGKGGVGKSNFSINLAIQMRMLDKRVIIIDADFGLANIEILFGVPPKHNVQDVLNGKVTIEEALTEGPLGVLFLSGGTGMTALSDLSDAQIARLTDSFLKLDALADYIIIDTRAGISRAVLGFIKAAADTVVVTTPDPTAIADAYALIKAVKTQATGINNLKMVVNCAGSEHEAADVFEKLNGVSSRFLGIRLTFLGFIPHDPQLIKAVRSQKAVSIMFPSADSTDKFKQICAALLELQVEKKNSIQNFILKLIGRIRDS